MKHLGTILTLLAFTLSAAALLSGEKGDEEGEYYGGKWPADIPKTTPVKYYLPFPASKSYGRMPGGASHTAVQNKYAIDFMMPTGSPVCASAEGIVIKIIESGPDRGGRQNSLIIQHADGMCTCYLHLKNKGVIPRLGDFVFQGDEVAYSGASGTGTPHLHFSVNKFEMLECVPAEFVESKSRKQWVSQNYSFEERSAKLLKDYRETEIKLAWGPRFGLWEGTVAAGKHAAQIKPKEDADIRLKRKYEKIVQCSQSFDEMLKDHMKASKDAFEGKDYARALELAQFGVDDFKDTEHEKFFADMLSELENLPNYEELSKGLKKAKDRRKKLEKAFKTDLKGGNEKKIVKAYQSFVKKFKNCAETEAVKARIGILKKSAEKKKR